MNIEQGTTYHNPNEGDADNSKKSFRQRRPLYCCLIMFVFLLLVVFVALAKHFGDTAPKCNGRGCNRPDPYSTMALMKEDGTEYISSVNFPSDMETSIKDACDMVGKFFGFPTNTKVFMWEYNGPSSAYSDIEAKCGDFVGESCDGEAQAKQGGQYYVSGTRDNCVCNKATYTGSPVHFFPSGGDTATSAAERAVHEYTHAFQKSRGGPQPNWMMEGGAVFNECLFQERLDSNVKFSDCFLSGGGGGGIVRKTRELYLTNPTTKWFSIFSTDRCCGDECPPAISFPPPGDKERIYYYDIGAFAVAFLLHRSGKGPVEFWTKTSGYWNNPNMVWPGIDTTDGWAIDCPEGEGWKGVMSNMLGGETVAEFYSAFEDFMVDSDGNVVSEADM
ncbi:hypothetical protein TL16_g05844 [Triparma laevis f. inornata]|uniref:Uncharacterized protein n=1 Tax=Triparma laevis f. inornata TaxID=1714386 RepID=A0A9W7APS1_9STRA|nr:hypothetical protein TL16_g05844 [Triparma laevis f. inornata]